MNHDDGLTRPQRAALAVVVAAGARGTTARAVALRLWPDSPAWQRRTRGRTGNRSGAVGGTMPMKAAQLLHRLADAGMVEQQASLWRATSRGRQVAARWRS